MNIFRLLNADEIECRVAMVKEGKGYSLLLYKDARCDMNILDETVGAFNWTNRYSRDNANCTVSIRDPQTGEWISKEDTGTESNTEKEKGLASDSFKRACFRFGLGRELYTAPFIWINDAKASKDDVRFKRFTVSGIGYDEKQRINHLIIRDAKSNKILYTYDERGIMTVNEFCELLDKNDVPYMYICESFGVNAITELTEDDVKLTVKNIDMVKEKAKIWKAKQEG